MSVAGASNLFSTATNSTDQIKDIAGFGPVTLFETVSGAGALAGQTVNFDLLSVTLTDGGAGFGNCASNAGGNSCSPAGSPFTFTEDPTGTQVSISFSTLLSAYTGTSAGGTTAYSGIFSTQLSVKRYYCWFGRLQRSYCQHYEHPGMPSRQRDGAGNVVCDRDPYCNARNVFGSRD